MVPADATGLLIGAVILGAVHGIEPGHGWPVAATYALDKSNKWLYGLAASSIIGIGHLVSSIAMVLVFFYAKSYFGLGQVDEPIALIGGIQIGGPVSLVAGVLLIWLGVREYRHGHNHSHGAGSTDEPEHSGTDTNGEGAHEHADNEHRNHNHTGHDHSGQEVFDHEHQEHSDPTHHHGHQESGLRARVLAAIPFLGGDEHAHPSGNTAADRGLLGIAWFAFVLGFAHEEEFEIIALCAGSEYCLELMSAYALTVIFGIVGLTILLIAGYQHYEDRVEQYTPYLPLFSAAVLILMGLGFITGLF